MPTVGLKGNSYDDREEVLLHFDRHRMQPVVDAAWAAMRAEAVKQNPHLDPTEAMERMLCGGCIMTFMKVLNEKVMSEADATPREKARWIDRLITVFDEDPIESLIKQLLMPRR